MQLTEILETELNKIWPSEQYRIAKHNLSIPQQQEIAVEQVIEEALAIPTKALPVEKKK